MGLYFSKLKELCQEILRPNFHFFCDVTRNFPEMRSSCKGKEGNFHDFYLFSGKETFQDLVIVISSNNFVFFCFIYFLFDKQLSVWVEKYPASIIVFVSFLKLTFVS